MRILPTQFLIPFAVTLLILFIIPNTALEKTFETSERKSEKVYLVNLTTSNPSVEVQVREIAQELGFNDVDRLIALANCESTMNPKAVNAYGNTPSSIDRGLFQFNSYWQRRVSDECAFDIRCSTETAIRMLNNGQGHLWTCNDLI